MKYNDVEVDTIGQIVLRMINDYDASGSIPKDVRGALDEHSGLVSREGELLINAEEGQAVMEIGRLSVVGLNVYQKPFSWS